ncbi:DNA breaking-rejoining enzyme, partial [Rhizoctonia solani]
MEAPILKGGFNPTPSSAIRNPREPISMALLLDLRRGLDLSNPGDIAALAVALTAFWSQCHLSESLGINKRSHDPRRTPPRSSVHFANSSTKSHALRLPQIKRNQAQGETVFLTRQSDPPDAAPAIRTLLELSPNLTASPFLFSFVDEQSSRDTNTLLPHRRYLSPIKVGSSPRSRKISDIASKHADLLHPAPPHPAQLPLLDRPSRLSLRRVPHDPAQSYVSCERSDAKGEPIPNDQAPFGTRSTLPSSTRFLPSFLHATATHSDSFL